MKPADYILLAIVLGTALFIVLRGIRHRGSCGSCGRCSCYNSSCRSKKPPDAKGKK